MEEAFKDFAVLTLGLTFPFSGKMKKLLALRLQWLQALGAQGEGVQTALELTLLGDREGQDLSEFLQTALPPILCLYRSLTAGGLSEQAVVGFRVVEKVLASASVRLLVSLSEFFPIGDF